MGETSANGYSDKNFHFECDCGFHMTHNNLRAHKFRQDLLALQNKGTPMQGTFLDDDGAYVLQVIGISDVSRTAQIICHPRDQTKFLPKPSAQGSEAADAGSLNH